MLVRYAGAGKSKGVRSLENSNRKILQLLLGERELTGLGDWLAAGLVRLVTMERGSSRGGDE